MLWPNALGLLILCSLGILTSAEGEPCTVHDGEKFYDLNPLKSRKDYEFKSLGGHDMVINVCRGLTHDTWDLKIPNPDEVGGYIRQDHGDLAIGRINTTLTIKDSRPLLTLTNGSPCKSQSGNDQILISTAVEFICDTSIFAAGQPRLVAQLPPDDEAACAFFIEWRTHFACPTGERGGPWGFFAVLAVIILVVLMLYIVLGTLYNRYVLRLTGFDQIPQFSLESMKYHGQEAVEWFKDAMGGLYEGGQRIGPNPVSHQAQAHAGGVGIGDPNAGTFVRAGRRGNPVRRTETNPVSHQSQTQAAQALGMGAEGRGFKRPDPGAMPAPQPPQPRPPKTRRGRYDLESGTTREESEFMLGDDDDDGEDGEGEGNDLGNPQAPARDRAGTSTGPGADTSVADIRGRDMGPDGVIRL